ncbi:MAG: thioredoxin [Aquificae bacterium]|nr:thioredoxin [Aquificota bacterium]
MAGRVITLTEENWDREVLQSDKPVLVDFWAPWCGPCRIIAPIIEELAEEFGDQIKVGKLNTDENPNIAMRYGIRAIPTLILFKNGEVVDTRIGVQPKEALKQMILEHLS